MQTVAPGNQKCRIYNTTLTTDFKMEMWAGTVAGTTTDSDRIAGPNFSTSYD